MKPRTLKLNAHRTLEYYTPEDVQAMLAQQTPPAAAMLAAAAVPSNLTEWLAREMPAGTVIGEPQWWANMIARRFAQFAATQAPPAGAVPVQNREPTRTGLAAQLYDSAQLSTLPEWCRDLLRKAADNESELLPLIRQLTDALEATQAPPAAAVPDVDAETKAWAAWTAEHPGSKWTAAEAFGFRRAFIDGYRAAMLAAAERKGVE